MATHIGLNKQKPSSTRFLPFLPRVSVSVDLLGYRLTWKQAPVLETLVGMKKLKKSVMDVARLQFKEMETARTEKKARKAE